MPLTEFSTKAELMLPNVIGNDIRQHAGNIVATFRRRDSDLLKSADRDVGSAEDWLIVNQRVGTQIESQRVCIKAVIGVVESLIEVIHAEQNLVGHAWG